MKKAIEIQPPYKVEVPEGYYTLFLAGSIDMGKAELWQDRVIKELEDLPIAFLNPRRKDWDSSWEQSIDNKEFNEQVTWELDGLDDSNFVVFYLDPNTMSPISLMELGLVAHTMNVQVCCPEGFWRKGNVDILCKKCGIPRHETLDELITGIREAVTRGL